MTILNNGNIGIGSSDPGSYKVYINGSGYLNDSAWTYASDRRLKENINSLSGGLSIIGKLNPVQFDYIDGRKNQFGFIAQDVEAVLPNLVEERPDGILGLRTDLILPIAVSAIKEQQGEIDNLEKAVGMNSGQYGVDKIVAGETGKIVESQVVDEKSLIFTTVRKAPEAVPLMIGKVEKGKFEIRINSPVQDDVEFNWWIVNPN